MLSIHLQPHDEYEWRLGKNPSPATFPPEKGWYPLYHQWRTYNSDKPIIVNTYNTGTGKTKAALLRLLKRAQEIGFNRLYPSLHNVLLIAPTNELLAQHVQDAQKFCGENKLPYRVIAITKDHLDTYKTERARGGYTLHSVLNDPSLVDGDTSKRATICVVNPDIFYYAVLFCYCQFDRDSLFNDFFGLFNYIIIDEFHYYDPKQLTTFLFFMKYSQHLGYIDSNAKKRQFCILTATPNPQVTTYLNKLDIPIDWIQPGEVDTADLPLVSPRRALAPVLLQVYNTEELQRGDTRGRLVHLVETHLSDLLAWLRDGQDGAIISSSLGMISTIHNFLARNGVSSTIMGRITGAELRDGRRESKEKQLILATPTVDIGYNFDRATPEGQEPKGRQNIDFLFYDAFSGDEFIQRLGRAGRVLAVKENTQSSTVLAIVDPDVYTLLEHYDQQQIARTVLGEVALSMPKRNDLYAYIRVGAILEILRAIVLIGKGVADSDVPVLEDLFQQVQTLFDVPYPFSYKKAQGKIWEFEDRKKHYGSLTIIPLAAFDAFRLSIEKRSTPGPLAPEIEKCISAFNGRMNDFYKKHGSAGAKSQIGNKSKDLINWLQKDLCCYFIEKARFTFRDSFQPPQALIFDETHLHSSKEIAQYDALHILKYYQATFYASSEEWEQKTGKVAPDDTNALAYCRLLQLRSSPLQVGLQLDATAYTKDEWEEQFAYRVTALHGLEVVAPKDHHGLDATLQDLVRTQFVPAFVVSSDAKSATVSEVYRLRKRARIFPLKLDITFCDKGICSYLVILGTMAFQVASEISRRAIAIDRRKTQLADDDPMIC